MESFPEIASEWSLVDFNTWHLSIGTSLRAYQVRWDWARGEKERCVASGMASGFWPVGAVPGFFFLFCFHFGDVAEVVAIIHKEV